MNKAFTEFKDGFQALDLTPAQASRLDDVSAQIDSLAKGSCDGVNCTLSPPDGRRVSTSETSTGPGISDSITKVRNVPSWLDESALLSELTKPKRSREDLAMGWDINAFGILNGRNDMHDVDFLMKDASTNIDYQTGPGIRTPGLPRPRSKTGSNMVPLVTQPTAPRSFASQETTFARRLYRSCIEKGYSLLLNPEAQAITYDRVFRLSLFGRSRSKIISSMRNLLAKGPQHDPIFGETAAIHIGGAGTHYPRKDVYAYLFFSPSNSILTLYD